jgi:replicative DNA helicase
MDSMINYLLLHALTEHPAKSLELDLEPEHFADTDSKILYGVIRSAAMASKPFDIVAAREAGADLSFIMEVMRGTGHIGNTESYAAKIKAQWQQRCLEDIGARLQERHQEPVDEVMAKVMAEISELSTTKSNKSLDAKALASVVADDIERAYQAQLSGVPLGISTEIGVLDRSLGGLHKTDLVVVAGRPGLGKTSLGLHFSKAACRQGYTVGFASAEMPGVQLGRRLAAMLAGVDASRIRNGTLNDDDWPKITEGLKRMAQMSLHVYADPGCGAGDVRRQAMVWKRSHGLDMLVVDYLGRLKADRRNDRRDIEIGEMCQSFKNLAVQLDIPVVLLAQLNRKSEVRGDRKPMLSDLRDSGEIEQEADSVLMLHWDEVANNAQILIEKNRHGETGYVDVDFQKHLMRWGDRVAPGYAEAYL